MRTMPAAREADPQFDIIQHTYDVHLSSGKWSVHLATATGRGRFFGPRCAEGSLEFMGKVVTQVSEHLPRQVVDALSSGGFDCAGALVA